MRPSKTFLFASPAIAIVILSTPAALHAAKPEPVSVVKLLAAADAGAGQKTSMMCTSCHSFDKGGPAKLGPNLWNIVNRPAASAAGFDYSDALKNLQGRKWTYEALDGFLASPGKYAPGAKMSFGGISDPQDRANLIAWLRMQTDKPAPLPDK